MPGINLFLLLAVTSVSLSCPAANGPGWRGEDGLGTIKDTHFPRKWDAATNLKWKLPLPDRGNSTPIIWNDRVFLTQAQGEKRSVLCVDRQSVKILWERSIKYSGP